MSNSADIYGSPFGAAITFGNTPFGTLPPQYDFIYAFEYDNLIVSEGDNDTIYSTGLGNATVDLGGTGATGFTGVTDLVDLGGTNNVVTTGSGTGLVNSAVTVESGDGGNIVDLTNTQATVNGIVGFAQNTVTLEDMNNVIVVNANATNSITTGDGLGKVTATAGGGTGYTSLITDAGQYNSVTVGNQNTTINGGNGFDTDHLGNGNNTISEAGSHDKIVVGTGMNTITDYGGNATIEFTGLVQWVVTDPVPWDPQTVNIAGTNNVVTEMLTRGLPSDRDITLTGGQGNDTITLGNGIDTVTSNGNNDVITLGTTDHPIPPGFDTVTANGDNDNILVGNANNVVTANGQVDNIQLGNGNNTLSATGNDDELFLGNGNNTVNAGVGASDLIVLGNGNNKLTANGTNADIGAGNGNNTITANGDGTTINLGTGNNTVHATGESDTINSAGGQGSFWIGSNSTLTLNGSLVGTTVDSTGANNSIVLNSDANASITDAWTGGNLDITVNADAKGNAGTIVVTGFGSDGDPNGIIDLQGFGLSGANIAQYSQSDGMGGTLIHLGTGSIDLVDSTLSLSNGSTGGIVFSGAPTV